MSSIAPTQAREQEPARPPIKASLAANISIIFSVVMCLAIVALGAWLTQYELATPTADPFFYDWKLAEPSALSRLTAWLGYIFHNLAIWGTIFYAQKHYRTYSDTLRPANVWAFGINALFIVLHYLQTAFFYDGLAQDIPSWTAQFTVIMMLYVIIAMDNKRRGMFFGRKINFRKEFYYWLREYHGYAFSFAIIYTFWFHPMVPTLGHIGGFLHVFLVMAQGSLMFTKMHINRRWMFLMEILVLPHAALVAMGQGTSLLFMFLYGFIAIFIVTQMYGLGLKPAVRNAFGFGFLALVLFTYTVLRPPFAVNEVIRIPVVEYLSLFATYGLWWLWMKATNGWERWQVQRPLQERAEA